MSKKIQIKVKGKWLNHIPTTFKDLEDVRLVDESEECQSKKIQEQIDRKSYPFDDCNCDYHVKPKDHKGNGCCDYVNKPKKIEKLGYGTSVEERKCKINELIDDRNNSL